MRTPLVAMLLLAARPLHGQQPYVAPNAPRDKPVPVFTADGLSRLDSLVQPYVQHARASYPDARKRYLAGLPPKHGFFVTAELRDPVGKVEIVFIAVDSIKRDSVFGRIWNQIMVVQGYRLGQPYALPESAILDWTITKLDGTEEGNYVGKFMDTMQH